MIISVFTEKYNKKVNRLTNSAVIIDKGRKPLPVKAQWDTGATGTCISKEVVEKLHLLPIGMIEVQTPSGTGRMNTYMIDLVLNDEVMFPNLKVMDSEIGNQGIDILIGMDIIGEGDFAVSNYQGKTQFSFRLPSQEHVNYKR